MEPPKSATGHGISSPPCVEYLLSPLTVHVIVPPFLKNMLHVELILFGK